MVYLDFHCFDTRSGHKSTITFVMEIDKALEFVKIFCLYVDKHTTINSVLITMK